jgi:hypothetical protein
VAENVKSRRIRLTCGIFATVCVYFGSATPDRISIALSRNDNRRGVLMTVGRRGAFAKVRGVVAILVGVILCFAASAASAEEPLKLADSQLEPVK